MKLQNIFSHFSLVAEYRMAKLIRGSKSCLSDRKVSGLPILFPRTTTVSGQHDGYEVRYGAFASDPYFGGLLRDPGTHMFDFFVDVRPRKKIRKPWFVSAAIPLGIAGFDGLSLHDGWLSYYQHQVGGKNLFRAYEEIETKCLPLVDDQINRLINFVKRVDNGSIDIQSAINKAGKSDIGLQLALMVGVAVVIAAYLFFKFRG